METMVDPTTITIGNETVRTTPEELIPLLTRYMAGHCDGARTQDGHGFNKLHSYTGRLLAQKPVDQWNEFDLFKARRMLSTYKNTQLAEFWSLVPDLPDPWEARREAQRLAMAANGQITNDHDRRALTLRSVGGVEHAEITLTYRDPDFDTIKNMVKAIPGRRWLPEPKVWVVPFTIDALDQLVTIIDQYDFDVPDDVDARIRSVVGSYRDKITLSHAATHHVDIPGLDGTPFPFQHAGIAYAIDTPKCLIADEMGLGKTIQGLAVMHATDAYPAIIVVPASLKPNWRRELRKWIPALRDEHAIATISGNFTKDTYNALLTLHRLNESMEIARQSAELLNTAGITAGPGGQMPLLGSGMLDAVKTMESSQRMLVDSLGPLASLAFPACKVIIINYDILHSWRRFFVDPKGSKLHEYEKEAETDRLHRWIVPKMAIADEAHRLKTGSSQRSKAFRALAEQTERVLLLTGTPVVNNPLELHTLIRILQLEDEFGDYGWYKTYYGTTDPGYDRSVRKAGWQLHLHRLQELNKRCRSTFMVRRLKKDVLTELPPKLLSTVPLDIDNREDYIAAEDDVATYFAERKASQDAFMRELDDRADLLGLTGEARDQFIKTERDKKFDAAYRIADNNRQLLRWEALKQCAVAGKLAATKDWIDAFLESGEKAVIFATHQNIVRTVASWYDAPFIMGDVPVEERMQIVDRFQNDPECRVVVGNIQAMGEGLTLTAASNVIFVQFGWNPKDQQQAEDRCHRIGQHDTVNVWNLVATETIEEDIVELIEKKREITEALQDGESPTEQVKVFESLQARLDERRERRQHHGA